ncbi:MAG: M15 family metallopeptidase [Bacteroides sp.]|nr:M15 family metallopeptidase [Bacteroides sp.]
MRKIFIALIAILLTGGACVAQGKKVRSAGRAQQTEKTLDERLKELGYVDIAELNPEVKVSLMYARDDNFTGKVLYDGMSRAWLHADAAKSVDKAQKALSKLKPGYALLIKDAARPMSVQRKMFNSVVGTTGANYVANPAKGGGLHNYGLAVDVTIVDAEGKELDMGTPVDHLGPEANITREDQLVSSGYMTAQARENRRLLRRVMTEAGFMPLRSEWWHFNRVSKAEARQRYKRLDF